MWCWLFRVSYARCVGWDFTFRDCHQECQGEGYRIWLEGTSWLLLLLDLHSERIGWQTWKAWMATAGNQYWRRKNEGLGWSFKIEVMISDDLLLEGLVKFKERLFVDGALEVSAGAQLKQPSSPVSFQKIRRNRCLLDGFSSVGRPGMGGLPCCVVGFVGVCSLFILYRNQEWYPSMSIAVDVGPLGIFCRASQAWAKRAVYGRNPTNRSLPKDIA